MESTDINMADYNKDEMDREESKLQYDPRMRYMETVHPLKMSSIILNITPKDLVLNLLNIL